MKKWKTALFDYEAQLNKLEAEYDNIVKKMNKLADGRDSLEGAIEEQKYPLALAHSGLRGSQ